MQSLSALQTPVDLVSTSCPFSLSPSICPSLHIYPELF